MIFKKAGCSLGSGRMIWIRRAHFDGWIPLQALLKIIADLHHRVGNPTVLNVDVALLLQIREQVNDLWDGQCLWWQVMESSP